MGFEEKDHKDKVPLLSHDIKGAYYQHNVDKVAKIVFLRFLICSYWLSTLYVLTSLERSPRGRSGELCSTPLRVNYLHKLL